MNRLLLYRIGISMFSRSPAISGTGDGSFRRSPLAEFGVGARYFAGDTEGCCVERAGRGRTAAGSPVAIGSSRSSAGHAEAGIVMKVQMPLPNTIM